ncbi:hypothetical protein V8F63_09495 [Brevundimonas sp. LF-1]|uniref:hypothetical protein n=1 Tax=Brevundimonas sp. LF-1 TaxID=3126100 RepID=UPI0030E0A0C6
MTADLSALIARLEAAEVGSRELGHDVLLALGWHREQIGNFYGPLYQWSSPDFSPHLISGDEDKLPNPVLSLDAALALVERVLPGWRIGLNSDPDRGPLWAAQVKRRGETWRPIGELAPTPALALCIAILRAKQGEG